MIADVQRMQGGEASATMIIGKVKPENSVPTH